MERYGWKLTVLIVLAALVFVWLVRAPILASYLTNKIGLNISLEWVGIWPSRTNIHNFVVKNPKGFQGNAFKAKRVDCSYRLSSLLGDPTDFDRIEIKDCVLSVDFPSSVSTSNNWIAIGQTGKRGKKNGRVIIRRLILTNFNIEIRGKNLFAKPKRTHFDRLEFDDVDSQEGFPIERLVHLIFQSGGIEQYIERIAKLHASANPRSLRRFRFFANRLRPQGYVDLQKTETALRSSNLRSEASFAIPSIE